MKAKDSSTLVGGKKDDFLLTPAQYEEGSQGKKLGQVAIIGRTNSGLFDKVVELICRTETTTGRFSGGIETYKLR